MKKKQKKPLPLLAVENLKCNYPDIDLDADDFKSVYDFCKDNNMTQATVIIQTVLKWRKQKQIFEIDEELCNILMNVDKLDDEIPSEVFNRLVYDCFYVKLPDKYLNQKNGEIAKNNGGSIAMDGFYYTIYGKSIVIALMYETNHIQTVGFDFYEGKTLRECMNEHLRCNSDTYKVINFFMQIVLYLCADNADIQENAAQKEIYKPVKPREKIQDSYREIRKWEVGYRYGAALKKERQVQRHRPAAAETVSREGSHARKRTHVRRGHYHHFWSGSRKDGTRKLVLKWISPVVVNAEYENVATIRKVK